MWLDRCEPAHLLQVIRRRLFVVVQPPGIPLPPGTEQLVPKIPTAPFLGRGVGRKVALKEHLPRALKVAFWTPSAGGGIFYQSGESVLKFSDLRTKSYPSWLGESQGHWDWDRRTGPWWNLVEKASRSAQREKLSDLFIFL